MSKIDLSILDEEETQEQAPKKPKIDLSVLDKDLGEPGPNPTTKTKGEEVPGWESFVRGVSDMASFGFMDNIAAGIGSAITGANYDHMLEAERRRSKQASEEDPYTYGSGQLVGAIADPLALGKAKAAATGLKGLGKLAQGTKNVGKITGRAAAESGLQAIGESDAGSLEEALAAGKEGAETGAKWGAGLSLVPGAISKGYKLGKKLIPGAEGAANIVNKTAAKMGSMTPWQGASAADIKKLLDNPRLRDKVKNADLPVLMNQAKEGLNQTLPKMDDAVARRFVELEDLSTNVAGPQDVPTLERLVKHLQGQKKQVDEFKDFYSAQGRKTATSGVRALEKGGPGEALSWSKNFTPKDLGKLDGGFEAGEEAARVAKRRTLEYRRFLDDQLKNRDFSTLPKYDKDMIRNTRDELQKALKTEFSGAAERAKADELYSQYKTARDGMLDPITKKTKSGARELAEEKLDSLARSKTARGRVFDQKIQDMEKFMLKAEPDIGKLPEVQTALRDIKDLREVIEMQGLQQSLQLAGGGPTSRAVNNAMQLLAASSTGGLTLLALPVTDPIAWTRLLDGLGASGEKVGRSILNATRTLAEKNPAMFARLTQMQPQEQEEK